MELIYLVVFIYCLPSVLCDDGGCYLGYMLCGFTIFIMFIIIIALSIALHMVKNNKSLLGISINRKPTYIRQESGLGATLCNVTSINNMNDQCRNDGSTLTVNSGIVEISGLNEPETPKPVVENKPPCLLKKPINPSVSIFQKAQMDDIIAGVLNRQQKKSDSATFRELDALAKLGSANIHEREFSYRRNSASLNELDALANSGIHESLYENARSIGFMKNKSDVKDEHKWEEKIKTGSIPNITYIKDSVKKVDPEIPVEEDEDEQEVYDTLPNPVRCRSSDAESDGYVENLHLYDMPPRKSWEASENRHVVMDHDTQYLLPLSKRVMSEEEENLCYINANNNS